MSVSVYHFSPTGSTKQIALAFGRALDQNASFVDLAAPGIHGGSRPIPDPDENETSLALFAVPVFAGRVPAPAIEAIERLDGKGVVAASAVVYGNRDFDDALIELNDVLTRQGFAIIASGAFVARHSMLPSVAAKRPDASDLEDVSKFARLVAEKAAAKKDALSTPDVPGNRPYKEASGAAWVPTVSDDCILCGICAAQCPVEAIPRSAPNTTEAGCFQCMRCVAVCPKDARSLPAPVAAMISEKLGPVAGVRKPNQMWV